MTMFSIDPLVLSTILPISTILFQYNMLCLSCYCGKSGASNETSRWSKLIELQTTTIRSNLNTVHIL